MNKQASRLAKYGADFIWFLGAGIFLAQTYRAVAYYLFDKPMAWNYTDIAIGTVAFSFMFIQSGLKSAVVGILKSMSDKVSRK